MMKALLCENPSLNVEVHITLHLRFYLIDRCWPDGGEWLNQMWVYIFFFISGPYIRSYEFLKSRYFDITNIHLFICIDKYICDIFNTREEQLKYLQLTNNCPLFGWIRRYNFAVMEHWVNYCPKWTFMSGLVCISFDCGSETTAFVYAAI